MKDFSWLNEFIGKRFKYLVLIKVLPRANPKRINVEVICDCGESKVVDWGNLRSGKTKSCGCRQHPEKFEGAEHPLRKIWTGIKQRCYNPKNKAFMYYGAKGVVVCDEWKNDYRAFYSWCIDNGWESGLEIDKDIKGPSKIYSPQTCSIVTHKENMGATGGVRISEELQQQVLSSRLSGRQLEKMLPICRNTISKIRNSVL